MVEFLLLDLDDTILDFQKGEEYGLRKTLLDAGIEPTEAICARYSQINKAYWKRLELGEVTRDDGKIGLRVNFDIEKNVDPIDVIGKIRTILKKNKIKCFTKISKFYLGIFSLHFVGRVL